MPATEIPLFSQSMPSGATASMAQPWSEPATSNITTPSLKVFIKTTTPCQNSLRLEFSDCNNPTTSDRQSRSVARSDDKTCPSRQAMIPSSVFTGHAEILPDRQPGFWHWRRVNNATGAGYCNGNQTSCRHHDGVCRFHPSVHPAPPAGSGSCRSLRHQGQSGFPLSRR